MSIELIGVLTILVGGLAFALGPGFAFSIFIPSTLLGSAAAIIVGGATIQPAHLMLGFVALALLNRATPWSTALRSIVFPKAGFWLLLSAIYGVASAFLFPRLFAGMTDINAIGATEYGPSLLLVPLGPTSGNLTQSIYLLADVLCFVLTVTYASNAKGFATITLALTTYCAANIAFAVLDVVTYSTGTDGLLQFMRNSTYQLHVETVFSGLKRIIGSFTEAASFAYASLGVLGFTGRLWLAGYKPRLMGSLCLISTILLALSTSSTAYAATPVVLTYLYLGALLRTLRGRVTSSTFTFVLFAPLCLITIGCALILIPSVGNALFDFLDVLLFNKGSSLSGIERGQWNSTALQNLVDTFGLGGGLGSIRASSFPIAVMSNIGIIGGLAVAIFLFLVLFSHSTSVGVERDIQIAAKAACFSLLVGATISGTLVDLGLPFFVFAALASVPCKTSFGDALPSTLRRIPTSVRVAGFATHLRRALVPSHSAR
ncbi:hypothetical protein [Lichenihabitans psoromatis]|uniref:hypothetical protein n=1 Tax=Lichenihabitans psoromatis TaxID=2528642 RepID=UPI0010384356|nr:hypothetical protein [Lichenihabitans psoromatis]